MLRTCLLAVGGALLGTIVGEQIGPALIGSEGVTFFDMIRNILGWFTGGFFGGMLGAFVGILLGVLFDKKQIRD